MSSDKQQEISERALKSVVTQLSHIKSKKRVNQIHKETGIDNRKISKLISDDTDLKEKLKVPLNFIEMGALHHFLIEEKCVGFLRQSSLIDELLHKELQIVMGRFNTESKADTTHFDVNAVTELISELASRGHRHRCKPTQRNLIDISDLMKETSRPIIMVGSPRASKTSERLCCQLLKLERRRSPQSRDELVAPFYFYWPTPNKRGFETSGLQLPVDTAEDFFGNAANKLYGFALLNKPSSGEQETTSESRSYTYHVINQPETQTETESPWDTYGVILAGYLLDKKQEEDEAPLSGQLCIVLCGADGPATEACAKMLPQLDLNFSKRDGSEVLIFPIKAKVRFTTNGRELEPETENFLAKAFCYSPRGRH